MTMELNLDPAPERLGSDKNAAPVWARRFADCAEPDARQLGGKGASLARLHQQGLPVPDGFCIEAACLDEVATLQQLALDEALASGDAARWARMAEQLRAVQLPSRAIAAITLAYEALGAGAVAVRSSACDEDGQAHSFAGQHDSFLQVQGLPELLQRLRDCWASLFNPAALAYRRQHGGALAGARMAVVVQRMVPAGFDTAAGVAFARDPLQPGAPRLLIEACVGLGEGLVSGRVVSDAYLLATGDLRQVEQRILHKPAALLWSPERREAQLQPLPAAARERAVLSEAARHAVGELLQRCTRLQGSPQDIEWALDAAGRLWLLQSRPITTLDELPDEPEGPHQGAPDAQRDARILWSRMDIGEIFTGRMSPLGISFARYYQYRVHRECGKGIGLLDLGDPDEYMGYHRGHVYLNVAYTAYLLSQTPPGLDQTPFLHRFTSEEVSLSDYRNPYGLRHGRNGLERLHSQLYWFGKTLGELVGARRRARRMIESRRREYERACAQDLGALDQAGLRDELRHALDYFRAMHIGYLPFYINAFGLYGLLEELCGAWLPGRGLHLQNRLKGDMSNLRTVESARDLWALTQALCAHPGLRELLQRTPAEQVHGALLALPEGRRFLTGAYADFMRDNGVRGREEMELTHPRWVDDPCYVFQMVKTYLQQGFGVDQRLAASGQQRGQDTEALLRELTPRRRWLLRQVMRLYCGCSRLREDTRMSMITSIWLVRRVVVELTRRLVAQGLLHDMDEMAWLDFEQLRGYLEGELSAEQAFARPLIEARRRRQQAWLRAGEPALTFIGAPPTRTPQPAPPAAAGGDGLAGLGTSHGVVRGRARVIHDLSRQAAELQAGEIIVTTFTDASWTPIFALAGGVVTDIGSMLSHSSIVAREFGIPSVVNTRHASSRVRTGDWLTVDGERGTVRIEPATDTKEPAPC
ncbi:hypothetical protein G8A07_12180 [Roseateles sp. DAIF2]|uniref:PEP/pyruvate-binding domain-containing protein n=1 Tax=Roseateles sp. DAIF2 TaxID=2714952 RepID=UPI0018A2AB3A|nr:PEP/pyruvate-binding domain-containing protein [Roseateles sp. DAIF2]QPF73605.1 hypothetical protein G8A07_12180 [Roseateles sp. DAIF2]